MNLVPADVVAYGTITGRTTGLITTIPNPKNSRKIGTMIKEFLNSAPEGFTYVGFDFSALELVIAAAMQSARFCRDRDLKLDPMATEAGRRIFTGNSDLNTDIHSVIAAEIGVARSVSKTLSYSTMYGAGKNGLVSLLRVAIPGKSEKELTEIATAFLLYFKGEKSKGTRYYAGGLFSEYLNEVQDIIFSRRPTLPFLESQISSALWPQAVGQDYMPGRGNFPCQAGGSEILDWTLVNIVTLLPKHSRFVLSCHDDMRFLTPIDSAGIVVELCKKVHSEVWHSFFQSLGFENAPETVRNNIIVDVDAFWRKEPGKDFPNHRDFEFRA